MSKDFQSLKGDSSLVSCIETSQGHFLDLLKPDPGHIDLRDIALYLSRTPHIKGQTSQPFTIAQHSVLVMQCVEQHVRDTAGQETCGYWLQLVQAALLHDAAEAYLGDVPAPLKRLLPDLKDFEDRIVAAIGFAFEVPMHLVKHAWVREADVRVLAAEAQDLMPSHGRGWFSYRETYPERYPAEELFPLSESDAYILFAEQCERLGLKGWWTL